MSLLLLCDTSIHTGFGVQIVSAGHGPDFKAKTDQLEREEKARLESDQQSKVPERLRHEFKRDGASPPEASSSRLRRLWERLRG
jgi:hypothetical protein